MNFNCFKQWCMDKIINIIVVLAFLLFIIFIIFVVGISCSFQTLPTSARVYTKTSRDDSESQELNLDEMFLANTQALSNSKIEWGIKRNKNHQQPDLGNVNVKIIEEFNGIAMGNSRKPYIYLTFDLGYEGGYTNQILDVLKEQNIQACFFITGQFVKTNPELIRRMIDEGHIVGNHTVNHKSLPECSEEEIKKEIMDLHQEIYEKFDYEMKYLRPPKGEYSEKVVSCISSLGYKVVMWSFAYDDWDDNKQGREEQSKNKILENLHNGEVMLLHGTSKDNANILEDVVKQIKNQGYEFKSLDEFEF